MVDRSADDFEAAASHVSYELVQLVDAARYVDRHADGGSLRNACLESMLLHTRSLIDFLVRKRSDPSDLHRDDFVGQWSPPSSEARSRLLDVVPVVNKHLAHLTWERVENGEQEWQYPDLAADVLDVFGVFVAEAKAQGAHSWGTLELALTQAKAAHRPIATPSGATSLLATTTSSSQQVEVTSFLGK